MKKTILIFVIFLFSLAVVFAQENHDNEIEEGEKIKINHKNYSYLNASTGFSLDAHLMGITYGKKLYINDRISLVYLLAD